MSIITIIVIVRSVVGAMQHDPIAKKVRRKKAAAEAEKFMAKRSAKLYAELKIHLWMATLSLEDEVFVERTTMGVGGVPTNSHNVPHRSSNPTREGGHVDAVFGGAASAAVGAVARDAAFGAGAKGAEFNASIGCKTGAVRGRPLLSRFLMYGRRYQLLPGSKKREDRARQRLYRELVHAKEV